MSQVPQCGGLRMQQVQHAPSVAPSSVDVVAIDERVSRLHAALTAVSKVRTAAVPQLQCSITSRSPRLLRSIGRSVGHSVGLLLSFTVQSNSATLHLSTAAALAAAAALLPSCLCCADVVPCRRSR